MCFRLLPPLAVALLLAVSGCGKKSAAPAVVAPSGPRKVVFQTDWFPQAEHGGFYQALAKGYYARAGLNVEILPGGPTAGIKPKVAKGDADFGMNRSDDIIVAAARGLPLLIVGATMQHDPQALLVHDASPVKKLADLRGRTVIASVGMAWIPLLKAKYNMEFALRPVGHGLADFLSDKEAIRQCFVTSEPFFAQQHGAKVRVLPLAEAGHDVYQAIFCNRELARSEPAVVRAFLAASIAGWEDYLVGDPGPAHALILQRNPEMTPELLEFSRGELILRALVSGDRARGEDVGRIALARIADQMRTLAELGMLDAHIDLSLVASTEFLPPVTP